MQKYLLVMTLFFLTGCSSVYYGYPKTEWEALSKEQQDVARKEYQEIVQEKNLMVQGDPIEHASDAFKARNISKSYRQDP